MSRCVAVVSLLAVVLWVAPARAEAAPPSPRADSAAIDLPAGHIYEVLVDSDEAHLWIPLSVPDSVAGQLGPPAVVDVAFGNRHDVSLRQAFVPSIAHPGDDQVRALGVDLKVVLTALSGPGTYDVQLRLPWGSASPHPYEVIKTQVVVPPAQLRAVATVLLDATVGLLGGVTWDTQPLMLSEIGWKSRISALTLRQLGAPTAADGRPIAAGIGLAAVPPPIPPGGAADLRLATQGDFPIGVTKGKSEVVSRELAAPVPLDFEVRSHRPQWFIVALIALGMALGYLTRVWLKLRVELGEKLVDRAVLRDRIEREFSTRPDKLYRDRVREILANLDAVEATDVARLTQGILEAERKLKEATEEYGTRRSALQKEVDDLRQTLDTEWSLPGEVPTKLVRWREEVVSVQTPLDEGDVAGAADRNAALKHSYLKDIRAEVAQWRLRIEDGVAAIHDAPVEKADSEALGPAFDEVQTLLKAVPGSAIESSVQAILKATHDARTATQDLLGGVHRGVARLVKAVRETLAAKGLRPSELDALVQQWSHPVVAEVEEELEWCLGALPSARTTLTETLRARAPSESRQEFEDMLAEGRFLDAAKRVQNEEGPPLGDSESETTPFTAVDELAQGQARPGAVAGRIFVTRILQSAADGRAATTPTAATFRSLARTKFVRTFLAGLGIVAVGYLVFEAKFVGTAPELVAIFFWGFSADVTVDALVGAIAKEKR
jgi:hypothetical protein